jgi:hypothetical protein
MASSLYPGIYLVQALDSEGNILAVERLVIE